MDSHSFNYAFMTKKEIEKKTFELASIELEKLVKEKNYNFFLDSVEYVLENGVKILRVICDSDDYVSIEMVTDLNERVSEKLDEDDYIPENYYLEVTSAGVEKELKNDQMIEKSIGKYVYVKLYEKLEGFREFYGYLEDFKDDVISIKYSVKNIEKHIAIEKKKIALIRLAIKF